MSRRKLLLIICLVMLFCQIQACNQKPEAPASRKVHTTPTTNAPTASTPTTNAPTASTPTASTPTASTPTSTSTDTCGTYQFTDLIVHGEPVLNPSDWPWITGLFHQTDDGPKFQCGATLVSRSVVVTAAHCLQIIYNGTLYTLDADEILLVMGRTNVGNFSEQEHVQTRTAQNFVIHPSYLRSRRYGTDIAFIELESPIIITDYVTPVCLWNDESDANLTGNLGTVVGWGKDENNVSVTETPRKAKVPIVDKQTCHASNGNFRSLVNDLQFCAGFRNGSGPCNGDSGSGLYVTRTKPDGEISWVIRGLVSRSLQIANIPGSCDLNNYVIYTDVAKLVPWMKNTSCSFRHPDTFGALNMTRLGKKYYYFELDGRKMQNWTSAQQFCRSHGLQLVSVETEEENNLIVKYLLGKKPYWDFWLGGNDLEQEGTWRWSNGQQINFTNWKPSLLKNNRDWNCLVMLVWRKDSYGWYDHPCSYVWRFVCELEDVCS